LPKVSERGSLAPVNPDWFYQKGSAFLVRLTQVVLEKRPLNECSSSSSSKEIGKLRFKTKVGVYEKFAKI